MLNRRRIPLVVAGICVLVLAASAAAAPNSFTAALAPAHVKPSTSAAYTLTLVSGATSDQADKAKVAIPVGFADPTGVTATATAAGNCNASSWEPDGTLIAGGTINLKKPSGGGNTNLCAGATLTVKFTAVSPATTGSYTWTPQLFSTVDGQPFGPFTGNVSVDVDGTAPNTAITSAPATVTSSTSAQFSFVANEAGSTFQCLLDNAAFAACTSPQSYTALGAGSHTFQVRAIDAAGNVDGTPASHAWTIDTTPPSTAIIGAPPSITNQTSASFTFTASEAGSTFQCRLDSAAVTACTSPQSYTGLPAGSHTFQVRATDAAGNADGTPASYGWTIDTTPPDTTITAGPPATTNQTTASFSFTSSEGASTFECRLDGGAFAACPSPKSFTGLPAGVRTFEVRARDQAGNIDATPASRSWTIDLFGAATTIVTAPPGLTNSTSASFTFTASEQGTTFECSLDGALFSQCVSPKAYGGLADGQHRFSVRAIDSSTNTGPEASHAWRIDTRPPRAVVPAGPPAVANSRSATFTFSADEPSTFQCRLDTGGLVPCSSPASYQNLGEGTHTFVAVPTDAIGNIGASASYSWTIDVTAPQTALTSRTKAVSATFRFSATEQAAFECKLDAGRFAPCTSPKTYGRLRRTRHTFSVRAIDAAGNPDPTPAVHRWTIGSTVRTAKAAALLAPPAGARVASPPLLRWRRVARASYYNVQLYRGRVKVLSMWPTRTHVQLHARWAFLGRQYRLTSGKYTWYVWPRFGRGAKGRYGNVLGQSTFTVKSGR